MINEIVGISRSTFYRALEGSDLIGYTDISNQELNELIIRYNQNHPHDGERMIIGYLRNDLA